MCCWDHCKDSLHLVQDVTAHANHLLWFDCSVAVLWPVVVPEITWPWLKFHLTCRCQIPTQTARLDLLAVVERPLRLVRRLGLP